MVTSCYPISDLPSSDLSYTHHSPTPLLAPPLVNLYSWVDGLLNVISTPPSPLLRTYPFFLTPEEITKLHSPVQTAISYGSTLEEFFHEISVSRCRLPLGNL